MMKDKEAIEPCTYVIFGATGNLSRRKLMPALYHLEAADRLPEGTVILAISRREWNLDKWLSEVREMISDQARGGIDEEIFKRFSSRLRYQQGDLNAEETYSNIRSSLDNDTFFPVNAAF
ncbi:MAG: glucose-6-phosphate dehydrogenase, partial [Gammaproteobacteria bacterium]|nr:glucose-6-phosphate dehydrogenase [Gammaproteobacteria bacterium]